MKGKWHIGFVLSNSIQYSETFFESDIKILQDLGYCVVLLPVHSSNKNNGKSSFNEYPPPSKLSKNLLIRSCQFCWVLFKLFTRSFNSVYKYYLLEKKDSVPIRKILAKIYSNSHILALEKLEYLIFGYGNLSVERENLGKALNAKSWLFFQGADIGVFPLVKGEKIYSQTFKKIDHLIFRNQHLMNLFRSQYGNHDHKNYHIIFNKIDVDLFSSKPNLGNLNDPLQFLVVSRLHWRKGLIHLINAMGLLHQKDIPFELKIVGEGAEFEPLFFISKKTGILNMVTFTGKLPYEHVKHEMQKADIFVNASFFESNCRVLLEAQATGLLVISSHWEGADEIVNDGKTGWLVPKRSPQAIADKIQEVINLSFNDRKQIAKNAVEYVRKNFNLKDQIEDFKNLFNE